MASAELGHGIAGGPGEDAKQRVGAAQEQLENRSDDMFEKSAGEKVERGAP